ncbi:PREDICTED: cytochrome b ascorbate-dependent protein 3-like [Diuraphis noxia]|uniref:cytochrome b ascorbate-dependent protein 3-like n=1 Tax=Diuraphis noxia TaxID=143948 RepID=UPI000763AE09|nr:PREDICTED: cytochrome b ascorbate-dependent protein 3-like [Diuraphis noxia]
MYALQTVGSTTSSVKDDTEVMDFEDVGGNSIVGQIISNSNAVKRSGNLTSNGYQSSQTHPAIHNYERNNVDKNHTGLCFWAIFQAVGLTCVGTIICRSVVYQNGFFEISSSRNSTSITKNQFCNWHYSLSTIGFIYLYANSIFMIKSHKSKVSLPYLMLHTFAYLVSALGLCAMFVHKETGKPEGSPFYEYHLYSVHSWTGVLAATLFTVQWLSAAATFIMPCLRSIGLPLGKMFSLYTTILSTICLISGVNQHALKTLAKDNRTYYSIDSLILNGFGMLVIVFLFLITYIVIKPNRN